MKINVIVAYANNYVIGNDNKLPWSYKEDLEYFKTITTTTRKEKYKNAVIMGYNTWVSIGKKLKNRINIIITSKASTLNDYYEKEEKNKLSDIDVSDIYYVDSLGSAIDVCKNSYNKIIENIFIIGGESIYYYFFKSYFYKMLDKIYITKINRDIPGNKYFLNLDDKFYYKQISTSYEHEELEYRVLQYNSEFEHPDNKYIEVVKHILEQNSMFGLRLEYDMTKSVFPLNTLLIKQSNIGELLNELFLLINEIDNHNYSPLKLDNNSCLFYFNENNDGMLSCLIHQEDADAVSDIPKNILFGGLLLNFLSIINGKEKNKLIYTCINSVIKERNMTEANELIWGTPRPQPILEITDRNQLKYGDFNINDIHFLGLD